MGARDEEHLARVATATARDAAGALSDSAGALRDSTGAQRDSTGALRDSDAESRDATARLRDLQDDVNALRENILERAANDRAQGAADRAAASDDRAQAAADRDEAAKDRAQASRDRVEAAGERAAALHDRIAYEESLKLAMTDDLTGAWTRQFGLEQVSRELVRAKRTSTGLVLVFLDVNDLKQVNDVEGHLAGDALLRLVGTSVRTHVRPYDVVVRFGGDEFVCAMPDIDEAEARRRFAAVATSLRAASTGHSISIGLAVAAQDDTLLELIGRADADLLATRRAIP